jgi:hypothetical protein
MSWYRTGTIALTNGSATVTGTGTQWVANADIGEALIAPDGRAYEITNIASDTSLTISPAYLGSTASSQAYAVAPIRGRIADLIAETASLLSSFATVRDGIGSGLFPNGTVSAPALRASADQDTGLFFPSANTLGFVTGGVSRFTVSSNGIANALGAVGTPSYTFTGDTNTGMWSPAADTIAFSTAGSDRLRITDAGDVGIGTSSPGYRLDIASGDTTSNIGYAMRLRSNVTATAAAIQFTNSAVSTENGVISCTDAGALTIVAGGGSSSIRFRTNGAERAAISSDGHFGMGTTSRLGTNETLSVSAISTFDGMWVKNLEAVAATTVVWNAATSGDNLFIAFGTEAAVTNRGSITYNRGGGLVAYNVTSDYRAKDIIGPVTDAGATIDALKVYSGKMKGATIVRPMLVAHEAQEVVPYAVTGEKDAVSEDGTDKYQHMDHQSLVPLLIAEVQSLRARVAQLEATTPTITFKGN